MKTIRIALLFLFVSLGAVAQEVKQDTLDVEENDTLISKMIELEEIVLYKDNTDPEFKKQFMLLSPGQKVAC